MTCDVVFVSEPSGAGSWPAPKSVPSGAHRRLSMRNPSGISSLLTGLCPRDNRMNDWLPHAPTYIHLPSFDSSSPLAPDASLPGMIFQPSVVCHSHSSPFLSRG